LLKIDDSDICSGRLACRVATPAVSLLLVLSPPLLAELAVRRLVHRGLRVVVAAEGLPVPPGHYDVVVRNLTVPAGVTCDLVVDLPADTGVVPTGTSAGEVVALGRLEDLADLLDLRWPLEV